MNDRQILRQLLEELERRDPLKTLPYVPNPKQEYFHRTEQRGPDEPVLFGGAMGGGKLLKLDTKIATPTGYVPIADLKPGDEVLGPDGNAYPVTAVSNTETATAYKLTFDDGSTVVAHDEHLWLTFSWSERIALTKRSDEYRSRRRETRTSRATGRKSEKFTASLIERNRATLRPPTLPPPEGTVRTTGEIVATLTAGNQNNHAIPVAAPLDLPHAELPLDPYVLGVWLGDGTSHNGAITSMDEAVIDTVVEAGFSVRRLESKPQNRATTYHFNGLGNALRAAGVLGNKHVPDAYRWASQEQRLALLQGLMDTDGTVAKASGSAEFTTTNYALAEGAAFLIRSLGSKVRIRPGRARLNGKDCGPKWTLKFMSSFRVFRLDRKASLQKLPTRQTTRFHYIVAAERVDPVPMRCIAIDSPDHLYLFGDSLIATHNSVAICGDAIMECRVVPRNRVLMARRELVTFKRSTMETLTELLPQDIVHKPSAQRFIFPNGSEIHYSGLGTPRDLEKLKSTEWGAIYIDEASEIELDTFLMAASRLRLKQADRMKRLKIRLTSNPEPGWLKEKFLDAPEPGYLYIPALPTDNPHLADGYVERLEKLYKDYPMWRQAYLEGDWDAFVGSDYVFPRPLLTTATNSDVPAGEPIVWGVDVARFGDDKTVLVIREGGRVTEIKEWRKQDTTETADLLIGRYRTTSKKPIRIFIDDSGVGGGVTDQLKKAKLPVCGLNSGSASNDPEKFTNLKAELHWNFRILLEKNQISIPQNQYLITELAAVKYAFQSGKITIEKKEQLKQRLRRSPDRADALILAFAPLGVEFYVPTIPRAPLADAPLVLNPLSSKDQRQRELTVSQLQRMLGAGRYL